MDKNLLLTDLLVQNMVEKNIDNEMQKEISVANALIDELVNGWQSIVKDVFPEEVLMAIHRLDCNGNKLISPSKYGHEDSIYPRISVDDMHIAFSNRPHDHEKLIIAQGQKVVGFYFYEKDSWEYSHYGEMLKWERYSTLYWKAIPSKIDAKTTQTGMVENRDKIDSVYAFKKMLDDFQNKLPKIYAEISRRNAEYIEKKRNLLPVKQENVPERKKYKVTIEIEEV